MIDSLMAAAEFTDFGHNVGEGRKMVLLFDI